MAIQKKIQLYVSDTTGAAKTAKYYRIPLPSDSKPANRTDNIYKDLVRFYAKVSGDMFYIGLVLKSYPDSSVRNEKYYTAISNLLSPIIPDKLMNDGEGLVEMDGIYIHGTGFNRGNFFGGLSEDRFGEGQSNDGFLYKYNSKRKQKNNIFTVAILSNLENELTQFVPSNWIEFDSINDVLQDIQTWTDAPVTPRGHVFSEYTIDEIPDAFQCVEYFVPKINTATGAIEVSEDYKGLVPDAYLIDHGDYGTVTVTADNVTADSKVYVEYFYNTSGHEWAEHVEEFTFTGNTATFQLNSSPKDSHDDPGNKTFEANGCIIMLSHDLIGHANISFAKGVL
jgi:hypothetical protein